MSISRQITDFAEDTANENGTIHGNTIAVYPKVSASGEAIRLPLRIEETKGLSVIQLQTIWTAHGAKKAKAFSAFNAFIRSDNIGRFSSIAKMTWPQIDFAAEYDSVFALALFSEVSEVTEDPVSNLSKFICAVYAPKHIKIHRISELRWHMFCKHMAECHKLPFTIGALKQHIFRAHIQARVSS